MRCQGRRVLIVAMLVGMCGLCFCTGCGVQVTSIERQIDPDVARDGLGTEAEKLGFSNAAVRENPDDDDELLIDLDVTNGGTRTVTELEVWADFYNSDGRQAADEGENLLDGDHHDQTIPPGGTRRVTIELDSPEDWSGGKMVITVKKLRVQ